MSTERLETAGLENIFYETRVMSYLFTTSESILGTKHIFAKNIFGNNIVVIKFFYSLSDPAPNPNIDSV